MGLQGIFQAEPVESAPTRVSSTRNEFASLTPASAECELLGVMGMQGAECADRVRDVLANTPGVFYVTVDLKTGVVSVVFDSRTVGLWELVDRVAHAGEGTSRVYTAVPFPMWG